MACHSGRPEGSNPETMNTDFLIVAPQSVFYPIRPCAWVPGSLLRSAPE